MSNAVTFKVEGLAELDAKLGELSQSAAKGVLRRVGRKALVPFDEAWRARAPVLSGVLSRSGSIGSKLSRSQRKAHERESFIEVFAGPGTNPQAIQTEFGNRHEAAQPYARPAWDATKDQALQIVRTELGGEIAKAAGRATKRAAKLAAEG